MSLTLMGRKEGMARIFDAQGNLVICTVIAAEPNVIAQIKTPQADGYGAVQLAFDTLPQARLKKLSAASKGHFAKANIPPRRHLLESRVESVENYQVGQGIGVDQFAPLEYVDVSGLSKGKGHQGVMRRYGFRGGPASHGSGFHRHGGSCGMRTSPGRCLPGTKKSGRMGGEKVTTQNLQVVKVDAEKQLLLVRGAIPGAIHGLVTIAKAKKKQKASVSKKK